MGDSESGRCWDRARPGWPALGFCGAFLGTVVGIAAWAGAGDQAGKGASRKSGGSTIPQVAAIDKGIAEAWADAKVKPTRTSTDDEFLRRAYLDLLGRIPNVQEAARSCHAKDADKRGKLVEYLLNHPDFAKNFATQWTVLLIGRGNQGRTVNRMSLNNWLRKQFGAERPWNEIVHELVTATGSNKENGAANFVLAHLEFGAVPLTSKTTRLFLGQQIQCTQCHDHPSNDWKQADFWGINAFFKGIRPEEVNRADATGGEMYDHTVLQDEPTDSLRQVRQAQRHGGHRVPAVRRRPEDQPGDRRRSAGPSLAS